MGLRTKQKVLLDANGAEIDDTAVYVAIDSFVAGPHAQFLINRGHRLRGSAEALRCSSTLWLPDAADDAEIAQARQRFEPDFS